MIKGLYLTDPIPDSVAKLYINGRNVTKTRIGAPITLYKTIRRWESIYDFDGCDVLIYLEPDKKDKKTISIERKGNLHYSCIAA